MIDLDDLPKIIAGPGSPMQPLRSLGVLGDIHVEDARLKTAIDWLKHEGAERIVHVGDVCDGEGSLERTLALLAEHRVLGILGNHERWLLTGAMRQLPHAHPVLTDEVRATLVHWPPLLELATLAGPLLLCHGVAEDDMMVLKPDSILGFLWGRPAFDRLMRASRFRFVVAGHTHVHAVHPVGHLTWINAGTLKRDDGPVATLIDFERATVRFASLEDPQRIGAIEHQRWG